MSELALNRPVHLAGRDAYYQQAVKLLQGDLMNYLVGDRVEKCHTIASVLKLSHEHADFALRGIEPSREETLFVQFLKLLLDSAQALQVMTNHEHLLVAERELLQEFLRESPEQIDRSAAEHRHLADNMLKEILQLIQMAAETFQKLKEKNLSELGSNDARPRYQRAYESFQKQTI